MLQIDNDSSLNLQNESYAKLGTVALNSSASQTSLVVDGAKVTLSGGTVTMSIDDAANYIFGAAKADTLINEESISGAGHIGNGQMTLTNSGTIDSDDSAGMVIQANGGTKNTGTLEATAGSTLARQRDDGHQHQRHGLGGCQPVAGHECDHQRRGGDVERGLDPAVEQRDCPRRAL